jgi:hypothetical protein
VVLVVETPDGLPARGTRIALFEEVGGGARAGIADAAGERLDDTRALVRLDADMLARARGAAAGSGLRVRVMAEQGFAVARAPRPRARR